MLMNDRPIDRWDTPCLGLFESLEAAFENWVILEL